MKNVYTKYKKCYIKLRRKHRDVFAVVEVLAEAIALIAFMIVIFWFLCACSEAGGISRV